MAYIEALSEIYHSKSKDLQKSQKDLCKLLKFPLTWRYRLYNKKKYYNNVDRSLDTYKRLHVAKLRTLTSIEKLLLQEYQSVQNYSHILAQHLHLQGDTPTIIARRSHAQNTVETSRAIQQYMGLMHRNVDLAKCIAEQQQTYLQVIVRSFVITQPLASSLFPNYAHKFEQSHILENTITTGIFSGIKQFESAQSIDELSSILEELEIGYQLRIAEMQQTI